MEFGPVPSMESAGAILAHSVRVEGQAFKKGRVLSAQDAKALSDAGIEIVTVCRLDADDVHEDEAANAIAHAARGPGISCSAAFTGRVNLNAERDGILIVDPDRIADLNVVDEGITFASLPPYSRVLARQMVATAKIIPFGVGRHNLDRATPKSPMIEVRPFVAERFSLVQTVLDSVKPKILDKTEEILSARFESLGASALTPVRCPHTTADLAAVLKNQVGVKPNAITIVGASAIVDRRDVIPSAIEAIGGTIRHFGMPVDPGNLLLLGDVGGIPIIGAPGCVRSPKPNGYDWVLERIAAGVPVDSRSIMAMGTGGLLKEIASRPLPRAKAVTDRAGKEPKPASDIEGGTFAPRIMGVLLAAGQSRRMGARNKLLEDYSGAPIVHHAGSALRRSRISDILVVLGHDADAVRSALDGLDARFVHNTAYADGMASSVRSATAATPKDVDGILFCLGDMPTIRPGTMDKLIAAFDPEEGRAICVPTFEGQRGNPVLFSKRFFPEILDSSGDVGARRLMERHPDDVAEVAVDDPGILLDIDTPDKLASLRDGGRKSDT